MNKTRKVTPEMAVEMQRLRNNGMTAQQVAEKYGLNMATVCMYTNAPDNRKNKLTVRPEWAQEWDEARMRVLGR